VKIQKFLVSMHDIFRAQVEPLITERKEDNWPEIKALAEKYDSVFYQGKQYKETNQSNGQRQPKTAAMERPKFINKRNNARSTNTNRKKMGSEEVTRLRNEGRCFFCKGTGHFMNKCPKRNKKYQTTRTEVIVTEEEPATLEEYLMTIEGPTIAATKAPDEMV
jgi:hypothetical protein